MWVWVDRLSGLALDAGISATILWGLVALVLLSCKQPARRIRVGRAAMIGSLAVIPLIGFHLVPRFDLVSAVRAIGLIPHPLLPPRWLPFASTAEHALPIGLDPLAPSRFGLWIPRILTLLYLAGIFLGLAWLALGWAVLSRLNQLSRDPSPDSQALYNALPFTRRGSRPRLRVSARVGRPVLAGVISPLILIPPELELPEAVERLRLSLLHELAHAERFDPVFGLLSHLTQALWFFVPPVWWVSAQLRLDQEFLADLSAAEEFGPPRHYASTLLDLAFAPAEKAAGTREVEPSPMSDNSPLFQRILMLLRCPFHVESHPPVFWSWTLHCFALLATLGVASVSVRSPGVLPSQGPSLPHSFPVSRLDIPSSPIGPDGRAPLFELPLRLPRQFDLRVELLGSLQSLSHGRVAGILLEAPTIPPPSADPILWHTIRIRRDHSDLKLWIDGLPVPLNVFPQILTSRLSVEPAPGQPASYRNLFVSW